MSMNYADKTDDYLLSTELVLSAGKRLRQSIDADHAKREAAIEKLESAAEQHGTQGAGYRAFMFSELERPPVSTPEEGARAAEDVLASIMTDLQIANTLMAAGQVLGETGAKAEPRLLDEALVRLDSTKKRVERSLSAPLGATEPGRFGFADEAPALEVVKSESMETAKKTFDERAVQTLDALVEDAKGTVMSVIKLLSKLDYGKVLAALSNLGEKSDDLPKVGRLFRQGVEKLKSTIDALRKLLGDDLVKKVKEKVEKVWEELKEGKFVAAPLQWAFGVEAARQHVEEVLRSQDLDKDALDEASNTLAKLRVEFKERMGLLEAIASAVALAGTLLLIIPALGQGLMLAAAGIYLVILAAVILMGMDYADSGSVLTRVSGVREIASGVLRRAGEA